MVHPLGGWSTLFIRPENVHLPPAKWTFSGPQTGNVRKPSADRPPTVHLVDDFRTTSGRLPDDFRTLLQTGLRRAARRRNIGDINSRGHTERRKTKENELPFYPPLPPRTPALPVATDEKAAAHAAKTTGWDHCPRYQQKRASVKQ